MKLYTLPFQPGYLCCLIFTFSLFYVSNRFVLLLEKGWTNYIVFLCVLYNVLNWIKSYFVHSHVDCVIIIKSLKNPLYGTF